MSNTDIKWFSFDNTNAPQLTNTWGCMIDVLDACLVSGFGSQIVSSIVIENGVGVATFGGAHNLKQFQVVEFSGANQSELNQEFKVLGLTVNTIEFIVSLPDQAATGTISCKLAPLGWAKEFSGLQKAVYRAKDVAKNPYFLRVDNSFQQYGLETGAKFARVGILETCANIDDLSGKQAPFDPALPTKNWTDTNGGTAATTYKGWAKWYYATSTTTLETSTADNTVARDGVRSWILVGSSNAFYILPSIADISQSAASNAHPYGFGVTEKKGDYFPFLSARVSYLPVSSASRLTFGNGLSQNLTTSIQILKDYTGNITPTSASFHVSGTTSTTENSGERNIFNPELDGTLLLGSMQLLQYVNKAYLGDLPLINEIYNNVADYPAYYVFDENNKAYLLKKCAMHVASSGGYIFDLGDIN